MKKIILFLLCFIFVIPNDTLAINVDDYIKFKNKIDELDVGLANRLAGCGDAAKWWDAADSFVTATLDDIAIHKAPPDYFKNQRHDIEGVSFWYNDEGSIVFNYSSRHSAILEKSPNGVVTSERLNNISIQIVPLVADKSILYVAYQREIEKYPEFDWNLYNFGTFRIMQRSSKGHYIISARLEDSNFNKQVIGKFKYQVVDSSIPICRWDPIDIQDIKQKGKNTQRFETLFLVNRCVESCEFASPMHVGWEYKNGKLKAIDYLYEPYDASSDPNIEFPNKAKNGERVKIPE